MVIMYLFKDKNKKAENEECPGSGGKRTSISFGGFRTVQEKIMINFVYSMGKIFNICRHVDLFLLVLG